MTETYSLFIDPVGPQTGSITLKLYDVPPDQEVQIEVDGSAQTVETIAAGQIAVLTFNGVAGQRVGIRFSDNTYPSIGPSVYLIAPNGSEMDERVLFPDGGYIGAYTLPTSGIYKIRIVPWDGNIGRVTVKLLSVPGDVNGGVLSVGGSPVSVSNTAAGQDAYFTFTGNANQVVTVRVSGSTMGFLKVSLMRPAAAGGTEVTSEDSFDASFDLAQQTLPVTGTYTIKVDPIGDAVGSVSSSVTSP